MASLFFAIFKPDIFRKPFHKAFTDVICCPTAVLGLKIAVGMPSRLYSWFVVVI